MTRRALLTVPLIATAGAREIEYCSVNLLTQQRKLRWDEPDRAVSMGSLLKPFLVVAYRRTHDRFPTLTCRGTVDGCWLSRGHGSQDVIAALANSCNRYFLQIASDLNRGALQAVSKSYGLLTPEVNDGAQHLIGLGDGWPQKPKAVLTAFGELSKDRTAGAAAAMEGMRQSAERGTARGIGVAACAKTGTAACSHVPKAEGDGFVVVLYPSDQPRVILLARQHGTTGANTALRAKPLLRSLI